MGGTVKGNAFRELTLVAGPNVSDGFLSSSSSSYFSFFLLDLSSTSRSIPHPSFCCGFQLDPIRRVMGPERTNEREKRSVLYYGSCSRFLESLISVLLVLFPCRSSPVLENRCPCRGRDIGPHSQGTHSIGDGLTPAMTISFSHGRTRSTRSRNYFLFSRETPITPTTLLHNVIVLLHN